MVSLASSPFLLPRQLWPLPRGLKAPQGTHDKLSPICSPAAVQARASPQPSLDPQCTCYLAQLPKSSVPPSFVLCGVQGKC